MSIILAILGIILGLFGAFLAIIAVVAVVAAPFYVAYLIGKVCWYVGGVFIKTSPGKIR